MERTRTLLAVFWVAASAAILAAVWVVFLREPTTLDGGRETLGRGPYHLETTDGGEFTEAALAGHPTAVFFGFTHCPDVCPTTLGEIGVWQEALGPAAKDLRFYFVTVDPERDTLDLLRDYLSWTPGVVGAAGPRAEVDKAITAFRIFARKVPLSDGGYTMDHTPYVMLFDREGRFDQVIAYREGDESAVAKLRALVGAS